MIATSILVLAVLVSGDLLFFGMGALIALIGAGLLLFEISCRRRQIFILYQSGLGVAMHSSRSSGSTRKELRLIEMSLIATGAYKEAGDLRNELRHMGVPSVGE
ncbi:hypothetical protein [Streptomyces lydicus]|uniref:hypothetical protein n=1 Tax=Streptomyces lydicus TaxID=47763 RepID=UPI00378CA709